MPLEQIVGVKTVRVHRSSITVRKMQSGSWHWRDAGRERSPSKTENHSISISTEILCLLYDTKKHLLSRQPPADTRGFGRYYYLRSTRMMDVDDGRCFYFLYCFSKSVLQTCRHLTAATFLLQIIFTAARCYSQPSTYHVPRRYSISDENVGLTTYRARMRQCENYLQQKGTCYCPYGSSRGRGERGERATIED
jgi:hypothetical protein